MCFMGGAPSGGADAQAAASQRAADESQRQADQARADEEARQGRLQTGMDTITNTFKPYNDDYYGGLTKNYLDFQLPQLEEQYSNARNNQVADLARSGNSHSSAGAFAIQQLAKTYADTKRSISDAAAGYANTARKSVDDNRSALVDELNTTADPNQVGQSAAARASFLETPPTISPLGAIFAGGTGAGAQYVQAGAAPLLGGPSTGTTLFNSGGSSHVVRT